MEGDEDLQANLLPMLAISIHSLRMEGDILCGILGRGKTGISIHSLRMEGDIPRITVITVVMIFQSTPSAWRETSTNQFCSVTFNHFNPLPPHGGRLFLDLGFDIALLFQSTPSAWRETRSCR